MRIIITSAVELASVVKSLSSGPPATGVIESIILYDFEGAMNGGALSDLVTLLTLARPTLRLLLFDRFTRQHDLPAQETEPLRLALDSLECVEEFISAQDEVYFDNGIRWNCWPRWQSLQRLALHNPDLTSDFIDAIANLGSLTHLAFDNADFDDTGDPMALLQRPPRLVRVVFLTYVSVERTFDKDKEIWKNAAAKAVGKVQVVLVMPPVMPGDDGIIWFRERVEDGTIWYLQGLDVASI